MRLRGTEPSGQEAASTLPTSQSQPQLGDTGAIAYENLDRGLFPPPLSGPPPTGPLPPPPSAPQPLSSHPPPPPRVNRTANVPSSHRQSLLARISNAAIEPRVSTTSSVYPEADDSGQASVVHETGSASSIPNPGLRSADTGQWNDSIIVARPLRVPKPWRSTYRTWTRRELDRERRQFWSDHRVGPASITWATISNVVDVFLHAQRERGEIRPEDLREAQAWLIRGQLTLATGRVEEGIWDEFGNLFKMPRWIVSDPEVVEEYTEEAEHVEDLPQA